MDEAERALAEVRRQREAMAERVSLPWWFRVLFAAAWGGVLAGPALMRDHERLSVPEFPYVLVAVVVLLVTLADYRRRSALHTVVRSRAYPSLRGQVPATAAVFGGGAAVVWGLTLAGLPHQALTCALVVAGLGAAQAWRVNTAIRQDVLAGG
ncbi:hypothetical protein [Saccharothrix xinjiangensis]|uniref:Uncharacterized protein n=1 Tax=Saccharothrix xinjiangensis TaxID=204798 RepID=A0ABV9XU86_9PSEU